jgi:hypothetical protein
VLHTSTLLLLLLLSSRFPKDRPWRLQADQLNSGACILSSMILAHMLLAAATLQDGRTQLQALAVALQHPALSSHPALPCSMARTCRSWRDAAQQCSAGIMHVPPKPDRTLATVTSLAQWLPKYAGLVQSIQLAMDWSLTGFKAAEGVPADVYEAAAAQLVASSLQLAATPRASAWPTMLSNAAAAAAAAATPLLRLQSFSINYLVTPGILPALPAVSLTRLELELSSSAPYNAAAPANGSYAAAIARLTNLHHLRLVISSGSRNQLDVFSCMLQAVGQLSKLTHLQVLDHCWQHAAAPDSVSHVLRQLLQAPCREWQQQLRVLQLTIHYITLHTPPNKEWEPH